MTDIGICIHSFQTRRALNALYEVCTGTPNGLESDHSCAVTNKSETGFWDEPVCRSSGCFNKTEKGMFSCFPSNEPLQQVSELSGL